MLLRLAYDGAQFAGYARQPDLRTVEGEVLFALQRAKVIRSSRDARFQSASRTDRGVSALGNAVVFDTHLYPKAAAGAFNSRARDVYALGFAAVPDDFNARQARERWYRYLLDDRLRIAPLRQAARLFEGVHDFSAFVKGRTRAMREIRSLRVQPAGGFLALDVKAPSFAWNLVRRIVAAILAVHDGRAGLADVRAALNGTPMDLGLAPPEPLVLMAVDHGITLTPAEDSALAERIARVDRSARFQALFTAALTAAVAKPLRRASPAPSGGENPSSEGPRPWTK